MTALLRPWPLLILALAVVVGLPAHGQSPPPGGGPGAAGRPGRPPPPPRFPPPGEQAPRLPPPHQMPPPPQAAQAGPPPQGAVPAVEPAPAPVDTTAPLRGQLDDARRTGRADATGSALVALAAEYRRLAQPGQALPLLEEAIVLANQSQDDRLGREAAMALAVLYGERGDTGMERTWLTQANAYRDRISQRFSPPPLPTPASPQAPPRREGPPGPAPEPRVVAAPSRLWPLLVLPLALAALWFWSRSHRKAARLQEEAERLARHQRHLSKANSALQEQASQLRQAAVQDALTGAMTRTEFARRLEEVLRHAGHYGKSVALMVFDLDHFKHINDSHGHLTGDAALKFAAGVVRENLRSDDLFGRFGGDEFLIGCVDLDRAEALALAEKIRIASHARAGVEDPRMAKLSLSIGIAHADPGSGYSMELLFSRADAALYAAKRAGRNCSVLEESGTQAPPRDLHAPRCLAPGPA